VALAADWKVPSLLIYAGQDRLVHPDANAAFAARAPASVVHSHCFAPMYHEIFNDTQRQQVFHVLKRWLDDRFAA
jgi:alpha-beta hydrolase superfamily lysophospholipase